MTKTLVALPALGGVTVRAQNPTKSTGQKVLRYAFRVAETGFDPAQVNDFYSSTVNANIFDAPLTYDFLARPAKIVPNTAVALPEVSDDFRTLTIRLRPGIYFQDHPAFGGRKRKLVAQDYVYSIKRIYDPKLKSPRVYLLENAQLLGMNEIRAAALKGAQFDIDRDVEGVRALDRYTFQLRLGEPSPRFHLYLADNSFLGAVAREVAEAYGCPGLVSLCMGAMFAVVGQIPGADIDMFGSNDPRSAVMTGLAALCVGIIFIIIPIVVGVLTLRNKPSLAPAPAVSVPAPEAPPDEPLPPAI